MGDISVHQKRNKEINVITQKGTDEIKLETRAVKRGQEQPIQILSWKFPLQHGNPRCPLGNQELQLDPKLMPRCIHRTIIGTKLLRQKIFSLQPRKIFTSIPITAKRRKRACSVVVLYLSQLYIYKCEGPETRLELVRVRQKTPHLRSRTTGIAQSK